MYFMHLLSFFFYFTNNRYFCRRDHRRFLLSNLSQVGFGKKDAMEEIIEQEVDTLKEILREEQKEKGSISTQRRYTVAKWHLNM